MNSDFRLVQVMAFLQRAQNSRIPGNFHELYDHVLNPLNSSDLYGLSTIFDKSTTHYIPSYDEISNSLDAAALDIAGNINEVSDEI